MDKRNEVPSSRFQVASGRFVKQSIVGVWHGWNPRNFILDATTSGGRVRYFEHDTPGITDPAKFTNLKKEVQFVGGAAAQCRPAMKGPWTINRDRAWALGCGGNCEQESRVAVALEDGRTLHFGASCPSEARLLATLMNGCDLNAAGHIRSLFEGLELATTLPHPIPSSKIQLNRHAFSPVGEFNGRPWYQDQSRYLSLYWDNMANRWTAYRGKKCWTVEQWKKKSKPPAFVLLEDVPDIELMNSPLFVWDHTECTFVANDTLPISSGNIRLDLPELLRTLSILCAQREVAKTLLESPDVLPKLLTRCGWAYPRWSPPLLPHIVSLWKSLGGHIRTCPEIEQAFTRFLPSVLQWLVDLEHGRSNDHTARAVRIHNFGHLDGWYVLHPQLFNGRRVYYKPFQDSAKQRGDDFSRPLAFLAWYGEEWRLTTALGDAMSFASAKDDVMAVERVATTWQVWKRPDDHSELQLVDNPDMGISTRNGVLASAEEALPQAIAHLCRVSSIGERLSKEGKALADLLDRMLVRTGGPKAGRAPVAAQVNMINQIFSNPPVIEIELRVTGEGVLRATEDQLGDALYDALQEGSTNQQEFVRNDVVVSELRQASETEFQTRIRVALSKNRQLYRALLEKMLGLTGAALTEPIAKCLNTEQHTLAVEKSGLRIIQDGGWQARALALREGLLTEAQIPRKLIAVFLKATATKRLADLALGVDTVCKLLDVPVTLRHSDDARASATKQQLINIVTPRILDLVLEVITSKVDENQAESLTDVVFKLYLPRLLESLADLCELPQAAEVVCGRDLALGTMLGVLVRATATNRDAMESVSMLSRFRAGAHPLAVKQLLRLLVVLSNHVVANETVAHGVFRADPVRTLVRVMETGAADHSQQLAAYALFKLCESSLEHRETAERHQAVGALLQFLKTGSTDGQQRASFALEELLEDSATRQAQFRDKFGVRPLVRILERERALEGSLLSTSVQTIAVHLASLAESGSELVEAGVVPVLLRLLETHESATMGRAAAALLRLSFHGGELRKLLVEAGVPGALDNACKLAAVDAPPEDSNVGANDLQYDVKKRSRWQLADLMPQVKFWLLDLEKPRHSPSSKKKHVMISYNWAHQDVFLKIKGVLEDKGFVVWMDTERMMGNLLTQMADAVESAFVVLMGFSSKYQQSDNCRSEAEYARHLKRPCIPCIVEKGFQPSGWLGLVLGEKLYYDFSSPHAFESTMKNLVREIKAVQSGKLQQLHAQSQSPAAPAPHQPSPPAPQATVGLNAELRTVLESIGLAAELGPLLVEQGVDSVQLLKQFNTTELNGMGVKWGHAKKLEIALAKCK